MSGFGICENPDILRVIAFIKILINVVKFLVPMGLIIMVSLDIGKGVISGENFEKIFFLINGLGKRNTIYLPAMGGYKQSY